MLTSFALLAGVAVPLPAHAAEHRFQAQLAAPVPQAEVIASGLRWMCEGTTCSTLAGMVAPPSGLCARLAREVGRLAAFSVNGDAFAAPELERCNRRAKP